MAALWSMSNLSDVQWLAEKATALGHGPWHEAMLLLAVIARTSYVEYI